ncbi:prolyl oligopeptidase family serine peptidase [Nitriliruptoraceae bacterium ZYF776]|nr:prolyl oligopeptidase family serine peptidase [Profundirhabdus halotolerans]
MTDGFPRQHARTRRFSLGVPRDATIAPDGRRVLFLRSAGPEDPTTSLWALELPVDGDGAAVERRLVDAAELGADDASLPAEERARRERARELAGGVTAYATDRDATLAAFSVGGVLHTVEVASGTVVVHPTAGPAYDPRISPDGRRITYVCEDALHVVELIAGPTTPGVTRPVVVEDPVAWGRAEFVAAEEMGRGRGHWWGPDASRVAVCRVDESAVASWHLGDPATPDRTPPTIRYPAAGTTDADVRLAVLSLDDGRRIDVNWDRDAYPYLARVAWGDGPLTLTVQSRDQREVRVLTADPGSGATTLVHRCEDAPWVELVDGAPAWAGERLVTVEDRVDHGPDGSRALVVAGEVVSPAGVQVRRVVHADPAVVTFTASDVDPTSVHLWRWAPEVGCWCVTADEPGVHGAVATTQVQVTTTRTLEDAATRVTVSWVTPEGGVGRHELASRAATPVVTPRVRLLELGERRLRGALLLPTDDDGQRPLPVLLDPYGGPHAQRVLRAGAAYLTSQWFADQGFAVLVVDGRGTPGRGPRFERAVHGDLATPVLEDQLDALAAAAEREPRLDLDRVAVRGWSFGGYLAALAVLRRPDAVRAGIAGAPVTDWHLYDTHYTERYLGHPSDAPEAYEVSSLVDDGGTLLGAAPLAAGTPGPDLLLIHGLADDNVVAAHAVRLSAAMLAAGRRHRFVPLSGVTHVAGQEDVAERLLRLQVDFLHEVLGDR